jgi:hypothetical protein
MKQRWAIGLVLVVLAVAGGVSAQDGSSISERFKIQLNTGEIVDVQEATLSSVGIEGTTLDRNPITIDRSDIRLLDRYEGTNGGRGALIGAGIGFATALVGYVAAHAEASSDPYKTVDNSKIVPIFLGFTGVGALIGWAVGDSQKRWTRVPLGTSFLYDPESGERKLVFTLSL